MKDSPVALPEILERLIAAHAEPHKYDAPVAEGDAVLHDKVQIVRFPAVVERKRVVHFAGATPEIPGHHIPSSAVERFGHAEHVPARAVSFEPCDKMATRPERMPAQAGI